MTKFNKRTYSQLFILLSLSFGVFAQDADTSENFCPAYGTGVLEVDSGRSQVEIQVHKAGFLKVFGHDHIIVSRSVEGQIYWPDDPLHACGMLAFEVESLLVDDPGAREKYPLNSKPSAKDIARTRENMRTKVLQSDRWPRVRIRLFYAAGELPLLEVNASLELRGQERKMVIPVLVDDQASGLSFSGEMEILQSDFGINVFTAVGGGLKIQDKLQITFTIVVN